MTLKAPRHSLAVAKRLERGQSLFDALHGVLDRLPPETRPKTSDVLDDLERQGVWKPEPVGQRVE